MSKNQNMKLDNRLLVCAKLVRRGRIVADIGTDHAYLVVWLIINGIIPHAIASDLRQGPLLNAQNNINKYNVNDSIETRLSNGLDNINQDEVDDIVMAGMGGELIIDIIKRAPWLKDKSKHLILQPMSAEPDLREFLLQEGFLIESEQAVVSYGKVYSVMSVFYDGKVEQRSKFYPYIGLLDKNLTDEAYLYIEKEIRDLNNRILGFTATNQLDKAQHLKDIVDGLFSILRER